jgi:hypothetical protein
LNASFDYSSNSSSFFDYIEFTMADANLPTILTQISDISDQYLAGFVIPSAPDFIQAANRGQRVIDTEAEFLTANTEFLRLSRETTETQARLDVLKNQLAAAKTTMTTTRVARNDAVAANTPCQARLELNKAHTVEHIVLMLRLARADRWKHQDMELLSLALRYLKDMLDQPDPCARSLRSHRIGISNGNHRVGATFVLLERFHFIKATGRGNQLQSGLHPEFIANLTIQPVLTAPYPPDDE